jgi:hypothetical protein
MRACWLASVVLLGPAAAVAAAQDVSGIVLDPHRRAVAGAHVELSCAADTRAAVARDDGTFAIAGGNAPACDLAVEHPGFTVWRRRVRAGGARIEVRLEIAPLTQSVEVTPDRPWAERAPPLDAATLTAADLGPLGPDSRRWLDHAASAAGAFVGRRQIFIDGMPAGATPDAALMAGVSVNADPFSAEHGGVDQHRIDIELTRPDRRWRFSGAGPAWMRGGGALVPGTAPRSRSRSGVVSGPVPHLPLTFFVQAGSYSDAYHPTFLTGGADGQALDASAATSRLTNWSMGIDARLSRIELRTTMAASRMRLANAGVGGMRGPSAGFALATSSRRIQQTWRRPLGDVMHRGGVLLTREALESASNSAERGLIVTGQLNAGGTDSLSSRHETASWHVQHVVERTQAVRSWSAGFEASGGSVQDRRVPNPLGRIQLERFGNTHGTWIGEQGAPVVHVTTATAALFLQRAVFEGRRVSLRTGLRGEWQRDDGLLVSPRATLVARARGFVIASSGGLFTDTWSSGLLTEIAARSTAAVRTLVVQDAPLAGEPPAGAGEPLSLRVLPGFRRRRDVVATVSIRRRAGRVEAGVEHRWTRGVALSGLVRTRSSSGLTDLLDSDRRSSRQQVHTRVSADLGRASVTGHYEFVRSFDDTDGAFSLPARQADRFAEWSRSTGIPAHHFSLVASLTLPSAVRAELVGTAASGSPYTIITGRDPEGLATFTDRGGSSRNAAEGPVYQSVSFYASRRFPLPFGRALGFDAGVRAENLFDNLNAQDVGRVAGTAWLGRPLSALAGRSISVWITAGR